ncbi:mechanosensitive ion channel [Catenovulum sp. SM1970]|uniref:mechanosensitive ion channel family protein n=1 Tax=Marinifaba aquimaris TaxID=2741323 RepID=UPI001573D9E0|nr:mechanosensitive ion channel domain-containing protein [Marinifaba aquimaris]NTS78012.1 mechanosensitive ion channel [Marinifaba aquimaris]
MDNSVQIRLYICLFLVIFIWLLKFGATKFIRSRSAKRGVDKRYLVNNIKNLLNLILLICLFTIWHNELQKFALSIAAFMVAIIIATKEFIQCFIGFLYISSTNPFRIGDWIQVDDFVGEVSETDWAKATLLEVDLESYTFTGRTIFIPNNQLMSHPIKNLNYLRRYANHSFTVTCDDAKVDPFSVKAELMALAKEYCHDFNDVAERYSAMIEKRLDVQIPGPEPSLEIGTTELGRIRFTFCLFCPTEQAIKIEQKLKQDFFKLWYQQVRSLNMPSEPTSATE